MKKSLFLAVLAVGVATLILTSAGIFAQQRSMAPLGGPQAAPGAVAVLDVSYIFKNHPRFKAEMTRMQADVEAAEADVKKERDAVKAEGDSLQEYQSGSPDYKQREAVLARRRSDLAIRIEMQRKDFLQREAKVYNNIYEEMMQEVEYHCANSGIDMVLRFNGDPIDFQKPEDVLKRINQPIIRYPKDRDITPIILDRLVKRMGQNGVTPGAASTMGVLPQQPQYK